MGPKHKLSIKTEILWFAAQTQKRLLCFALAKVPRYPELNDPSKQCRKQAGIPQSLYSYSGTKLCVCVYLIQGEPWQQQQSIFCQKPQSCAHITKRFASDRLLTKWNKQTPIHKQMSGLHYWFPRWPRVAAGIWRRQKMIFNFVNYSIWTL